MSKNLVKAQVHNVILGKVFAGSTASGAVWRAVSTSNGAYQVNQGDVTGDPGALVVASALSDSLTFLTFIGAVSALTFTGIAANGGDFYLVNGTPQNGDLLPASASAYALNTASGGVPSNQLFTTNDNGDTWTGIL